MALIGKMNYLEIKGNTYEIEDKNAAPINSPAFTGTPTAPTPGTEAGDTEIATVKYVTDAMAGAGAGTVTSVGVSNKTNGGLSITGSPITSSGTISIGHSNVLTSAQTTQAVYPIKIDKNGHISAYGSAVTIPTVPDETGNSVTGITIDDHTTTSLTGVSGSSVVRGVKTGTNSTTTASKASGSNGTAPILGDPIPVISASNVTVPIKNTSATSIPNVTAVGSGSYTQGTFTGGSFTQGTDSFTANVPTKIDTSKFNAGSYSHTGFSGGSGSFTQGTFSGGSGSFSASVSNHVLSFSHTHTAATHGADSHTHTAATYGTDSFTAPSLGTGFYTVGTAASFTQGEDEFTPATHGADSHTHTPPTLGTAISITGVQSSTTTASKVTVTDSETDFGVTDVGTASTWSFTNVTVPIRADADTTVPTANSTATTVVTSKTHTITDNGHTHSI